MTKKKKKPKTIKCEKCGTTIQKKHAHPFEVGKESLVTYLLCAKCEHERRRKQE